MKKFLSFALTLAIASAKDTEGHFYNKEDDIWEN